MPLNDIFDKTYFPWRVDEEELDKCLFSLLPFEIDEPERNRIKEIIYTGLFEYGEYNKLYLHGSCFFLPLITEKGFYRSWYNSHNLLRVDFETVLDNVDPEIQAKLLFHLNLFT